MPNKMKEDRGEETEGAETLDSQSYEELQEQGRKLKHAAKHKVGLEQGRLFCQAGRKFMLAALVLEEVASSPPHSRGHGHCGSV